MSILNKNPLAGMFTVTPPIGGSDTSEVMVDQSPLWEPSDDPDNLESVRKSCDTCQWYNPEIDVFSCAAFPPPTTIPTIIFMGYDMHTSYYDENGVSDNLITYKPRDVDNV
jgi:hypothetical protein